MKRKFLLLFLLFIAAAHAEQSKVISKDLKLVVVLCIDQMLPDYFNLSKFSYKGGFKRLLNEGLFFANADLNYALTFTSPGHATLSTGSYPKKNGVPHNWIFLKSNQMISVLQDPSSNPVEGTNIPVTPRNLRVTALGDWLTAKSPKSKVLSIGGKDRSAVLMGGRKPTHVFWRDRSSGDMITSSYYDAKLPDWVKAFNSTHKSERVISPAGNAPDKGAKNDRSQANLFDDPLLLDFALQVVRNEALGQRGVPDIFWIGLPGTDHLGHKYGTGGFEMREHLFRLDAAIDSFLKAVKKLLGKNQLLVVLTSDHGVLKRPGRKIDFDGKVKPAILKLDESLREEWKLKKSVIQIVGPDGGFLDYSSAAERNIDAGALENRLREVTTKIDGISDIYFSRELASNATKDRAFLEQYRNSHYPPKNVDFLFRFCENCLIHFGSNVPLGLHGSPYRYDTHIPLLFWGDGVRHGQVNRRVHMVDVAPTIARLLGIPNPSFVDGKPLPEILK